MQWSVARSDLNGLGVTDTSSTRWCTILRSHGEPLHRSLKHGPPSQTPPLPAPPLAQAGNSVRKQCQGGGVQSVQPVVGGRRNERSTSRNRWASSESDSSDSWTRWASMLRRPSGNEAGGLRVSAAERRKHARARESAASWKKPKSTRRTPFSARRRAHFVRQVLRFASADRSHDTRSALRLALRDTLEIDWCRASTS